MQSSGASAENREKTLTFTRQSDILELLEQLCVKCVEEDLLAKGFIYLVTV
jgi:hypothetical protein